MLNTDQRWRQYWLGVAERLQRQREEEDVEYFLFTLTADQTGKVWRSSFSHFIGFTPPKPRFELRQASVIDPTTARAQLQKIGKPPLIVNAGDDFVAFLFLGGHAIIQRSILEQEFPHWLEPRPVAPGGA